MSRFYAGIGSRATPRHHLDLMVALGEHLARTGWTLRSGGAEGADAAFEEGARWAQGPAEIFLPWPLFNGHERGIVIDDLDILKTATRIAAKHHPTWARLSHGARKLMARNVFQVLGADLESPVEQVVCWAPNPRERAGRVHDVSGGTGLAVRLAFALDIPVLHLDVHADEIRLLLDGHNNAPNVPEDPDDLSWFT